MTDALGADRLGADATGPDRVLDFLDDIEAIPATLDRLAQPGSRTAVRSALAAALPDGRAPTSITLTGFGSSRFAALQAEAAFRRLAIPVLVTAASDDDPPLESDRALTVAISNSGRTPEVAAAAARGRAHGTTLAITRDVASPVADAATAVLPLPIEPEASGVATTSFVATIAVLLQLAAVLGNAESPDIAASAHTARAILRDADRWLPDAVARVRNEEEVAVLGPWSLRGVAEQAALLFREGPRRTTAAFETAEWLHIGVYIALPGSVLLRYAGSPADDEVDRTVEQRGGHVLPLAGEADPLAAIIAPALLAAAWWRSISSHRSDGDT